jgi:hypothetical protein
MRWKQEQTKGNWVDRVKSRSFGPARFPLAPLRSLGLCVKALLRRLKEDLTQRRKDRKGRKVYYLS